MDSAPLISVITVVYNGAAHIESTIKSVIGQTYQGIEYIIIDGASTDGTLEIIHKYQSRLGYWISEPDQGIYDAMNKGFKAAHGDYVVFLNSGDQFYGFETLEEVFKNGEADVYFGETMFIDAQGREIGTRSELTTRKLPNRLTYKSFQLGMVVSHQAFIARKSLAPLYNLSYSCSADIDWCISVLKRSKIIVRYNGKMIRYLTQGFSVRNRKICLIERFRVFIHHFGLISAILFHIIIIARQIYYKLTGRPNF